MKTKNQTTKPTKQSITAFMMPDCGPKPGEVAPVWQSFEGNAAFGYLDGVLVEVQDGKVVRKLSLADSATMFFRVCLIEEAQESDVGSFDAYARCLWLEQVASALQR